MSANADIKTITLTTTLQAIEKTHCNVKKFAHIELKVTEKHDLKFDVSELDKIKLPESNRKFSKEYLKTPKLSDDYDSDLMILLDNNTLMYGFDYLYNNTKIVIPELNPVVVFYSNAVMFHRKAVEFKIALLDNSPTVYEQKKLDPELFANFFSMATNCIINLQATLESFANYKIPDDYESKGIDGNTFEPSVFHKIDKVLPELKGSKFRNKHKKSNQLIRKVIELRNEIIHLTPESSTTKTKYKKTFRKTISLDYTRTITAVREFLDFYEPCLIQECKCGAEKYYDILKKPPVWRKHVE